MRKSEDHNEFDRKAAERESHEAMARSDSKRRKKAIALFNDLSGLDTAIEAEIFPTVVSIQTSNGVVGTGFFRYSQWLVSNAHIISRIEALDGIHFFDYQGAPLKLTVEHSYHRPSERDDAPDIVIVNTGERERNNKCLPTVFNDDKGDAQRRYFYIDFNLNNSTKPQIKLLSFYSMRNSYPLIFECMDGSIPEPGSSGSPIIEARVVLGHMPKWQFKMIGVLYARCSPGWYNDNQALGEQRKVSEDTKLVCAIPVDPDFSQLLGILAAEESTTRMQQMAFASRSLKDEKGKKDAESYDKESQRSNILAKLRLREFERGVTVLNISLPEGLEKLYYKRIVNIKYSLLLKEVLDKEIKGKGERERILKKFSPISLEHLTEDFHAFIRHINESDDIKLRTGDNFERSPTGFFRIDVTGGSKEDWILDIQDNTGKVSYRGQPLSSVFAKVKIPKEHDSIKGKLLAPLFLDSQKDEKAKIFEAPKPTIDRKIKSDYRSSPTTGKGKGLAKTLKENIESCIDGVACELCESTQELVINLDPPGDANINRALAITLKEEFGFLASEGKENQFKLSWEKLPNNAVDLFYEKYFEDLASDEEEASIEETSYSSSIRPSNS